MVLSPPPSSPVAAIDTRPSQGTKAYSVHSGPGSTMVSSSSTTATTPKTNIDCSSGLYKSSVIPEHSSLPSPLSPPLSVSPPSFGPSMSDFMASRSFPGSSPTSSPHSHPSASPTNSNNSDHSQQPTQASTIFSPSPPLTQGQAEAWLAHAAAQRRHLSTASFSSSVSSPSALFSPDARTPRSPGKFEFSESETLLDETEDLEDEKEPELNVNVRPSELRASLMAHHRRSSAKWQMKKRSFERESRLSVMSGLSNHRQVPAWLSKSVCSPCSFYWVLFDWEHRIKVDQRNDCMPPAA